MAVRYTKKLQPYSVDPLIEFKQKYGKPSKPATPKPTKEEMIEKGFLRRQQKEQIKKEYDVGEKGAGQILAQQLEADIETKAKEAKKEEILTAAPSIKPSAAQIETAGLKEPKLEAVEYGAALAAGAAAAKGGAAVGAFAGPVGATAGGIFGFAGGFLGTISWERRQQVRAAFDTFTAAKSNIDFVKISLKAGTITPEQARDLWNNSILAIYASERNIKILNKDLNKFLSGGSDEAATIEGYMRRLDDEEREFNLIMAASKGLI